MKNNPTKKQLIISSLFMLVMIGIAIFTVVSTKAPLGAFFYAGLFIIATGVVMQISQILIYLKQNKDN